MDYCSISKSLMSQDSYFIVNKKLIIKLGLDAAALLSVLYDSEDYATKNNLLKKGYFMCSMQYIEGKLNLGRKPIESAIITLEKNNLVKTKLLGCPPLKHFIINYENVVNEVCSKDNQFVQNGQFDLFQTDNLICTKQTIPNNTNTDNTNTDCVTPLSPKGETTEKAKLDLSFITDEYLPIMKEWLDYKKEKRQTYTPRGLRQCYNNLYQLSNGDTEKAWAIVAQSIGNNYSGLFQLKESNSHSCGITMEEIKRRSMEISIIRKQMKENSFF